MIDLMVNAVLLLLDLALDYQIASDASSRRCNALSSLHRVAIIMIWTESLHRFPEPLAINLNSLNTGIILGGWSQ
jgi:hypothetical protein